MEPRLIILVTGKNVWVSVVTTVVSKRLAARAVSISDKIKPEYAAATGVDVDSLLTAGTYKKQHRDALSAFCQHQVQ